MYLNLLSMKVKMTAKRQATFPADLCRDLGLKPGDTLDLEAHAEEGRKYWTLRRSGEKERPWLGALKDYVPAGEAQAPLVPGHGSSHVSAPSSPLSGTLGSSMLRWGAAR